MRTLFWDWKGDKKKGTEMTENDHYKKLVYFVEKYKNECITSDVKDKMSKTGGEASHAARLLAEAKAEEPIVRLDEYIEVIDELRKKNLSFREIAEWLQARGVDVNRARVYFEYRKFTYDPESYLRGRQDDDEAGT